MSGGKIATIGMFDGVHLGHRKLLDSLVSLGKTTGRSTVVFTFDRHPLSLVNPAKEPKYLASLASRVALLRSYGVDEVEVLPFDENLRKATAAEFLKILKEKYGVGTLLMGFNHRFGSDRLTDFNEYSRLGKELGIELCRCDEYKDASAGESISSSAVRDALKRGDVAMAAKMLGRDYEITGTVVDGKKLGRRLGFPTANIRPDAPSQLIPAEGVYAVEVTLPDGLKKTGVLNIGRRPTVDRNIDARESIEVYIIDWEGDVYGRELTVAFVGRLRDEQRFDSIEALTRQLHEDVAQARQILY